MVGDFVGVRVRWPASGTSSGKLVASDEVRLVGQNSDDGGKLRVLSCAHTSFSHDNVGTAVVQGTVPVQAGRPTL